MKNTSTIFHTTLVTNSEICKKRLRNYVPLLQRKHDLLMYFRRFRYGSYPVLNPYLRHCLKIKQKFINHIRR